MNEDELLKKRLYELSNRAYQRGYATFSEFLNQEEISTLMTLKLDINPILFGGYDTSERCIACFSEDDIYEYPIKCIKIEPVQQRFADKLTHRDFLGAIMNLGINRNMIGDIKIDANTGYIFCIDSICEYIIDSIDRVKHTSVKCEEITELPKFINQVLDISEIIVSSTRVDAVVASVLKLSRSSVSKLFSQEKIFINSRIITKESYILKDGDRISVRGYGKFIFDSEIRRTKKDRIVIGLRILK